MCLTIPGRLAAGQRTLNPSTEVRSLPREPSPFQDNREAQVTTVDIGARWWVRS